ncbi:MAG TPA: hypothetical protein VN578_23325 [Candidatus Binatia bacterium]|nr:hypothetical protein [Candidatus Binatia bacterium]
MKLLTTSTVALATLAGAAAWFIHANSGTAKDACLRNLREIDAAIQQASTNVQPVITNRTVSSP